MPAPITTARALLGRVLMGVLLRRTCARYATLPGRRGRARIPLFDI